MLREISVLAKLNLCNIYGINVFRNNKDKKAKKIYVALAAVMLVLVAMIAVYVGLLVYGYVTIGLGEVIPAYLIMIASLIILCFGIFKAGPVIFEKKGYDILCSLPVSSKSIVTARFIRMYAEDMVLTLTVMVPGIIVYGLLMKPSLGFYASGTLVALLLPFAPMTISVILGAFVTAISSRTKYKSVIGALLPIAIVLGALVFTSKLSLNAGQITPEMLADFAGTLTSVIAAIYPPAIWLGNMMLGIDTLTAIMFVLATFVIFGITVFVIGTNLQGICQGLYGTVARHDYIMKSQVQNKVIVALLKREFKRYFASTVYFSNTIMGPILAVVMAASLLFIDIESALSAFPMEIDVVTLLPLALGTTFCIMNTTSTSVSMEGKEWWLIKSLPLTTKQILDGKLLMNLVLFAPFYVICVVISIIALKPLGLELIWVIISPAVLIVFSCVWGLFINLKFPVFNWENETSVVKQSMSAMVGGLCSALVGIAMIFALVLAPASLAWALKAGSMVVLVIATVMLYNRNNVTKLEHL